jgi:hypothetical protein
MNDLYLFSMFFSGFILGYVLGFFVGRSMIRASQNRPVEPTNGPFKFCCFEGDPPHGYDNWNAWAMSETRTGAKITAWKPDEPKASTDELDQPNPPM